ncbi:probable mediator of RNA polymerase ii transcription subunit 26c [Phtheirospermum japonicum]|uniref:Probable mediator of RNA polymerase ii transcription subunit 26c n=1 Tax=Phtheirospermum japonicum TaxID=374723 RepID=A0A830BMX1_9LAMI|nr:probable mediator of RNA polymerase ii transcription subunit 26c [Phtheirospermum japonicum]
MDLNEFRSFILDSGLDIWTWIDMSISVACADHENELKNRRDAIIQRLYASRCQNCDYQFSRGPKCNFKEIEGNEECQHKEDVGFDYKPEILQSGNHEEDNEQKEILEIKIHLDDQNQSEGCLIDLLQRLVGMDTTFKTLKETDIGRHVSRLRKHSSNEVRRLVKFLVRKWKDTVDEWEKVKHGQIESDKLGSAKKRLIDQNLQETQHAKKQRTSEIMDFHNIPKMKNGVHHVTNNRGSVPVKYW